MKRVAFLTILICVSTASWSDILLTDHQMQVFSGISSSNSWLGAGLCMEGIGLIGVFATIGSFGIAGDPTLFYVSVGAFGVGIIIQMISSAFVGIGCFQLGDLITREGSVAPKPSGAAVWSLISAGSMGAAFILASIMSSAGPYGMENNTIQMLGGVLSLTGIISAGITYFCVNGYGEEIGWAEYRRARDLSAEISRIEPQDTGMLISIPIVSIRY